MRLTLIFVVAVSLVALVTSCATVKFDADECPADTADCNDDVADGCETDLGSIRSCGGCGIFCDEPANASAVCQQGQCGFVCQSPLIRCDDICQERCVSLFDTAGEFAFTAPPACRRVAVKVWGAGGGHGAANTGAAAGGYAEANYPVDGSPLTIVIGAPGESATGAAPGNGGAPGGGAGGSSNSQGGGGGGGFSGIFSGAVDVSTALVIAGGGGGSGGGVPTANTTAGAGGGVNGQNGSGAGTAGTADSGFAPLLGGDGALQGNGDGGGGGGGGFFGGNGGLGANSDAQSGGGGSAFANAETDDPVLVTGDRAAPGNADDSDRGDSGAPERPGRVVIDCIDSSDV